jgi:hypothetical protein
MSQGLELDLGREVERRLEAQAGALQGLLGLAERMLNMAAGPEIEADHLNDLVDEDQRFFERLKQLEEGLVPLRKRWLAENPAHERREAVERAAQKVQELIGQLTVVQEGVRARLEAAQARVIAELERLPRRPRRGQAKRTGKLLDCRG